MSTGRPEYFQFVNNNTKIFSFCSYFSILKFIIVPFHCRIFTPITREQVQRITELITGQGEKNNVDKEPSVPVTSEDLLKDDDGIDKSDLWLVRYDELAQKSADIPLSHLGCCKASGKIWLKLAR